MSASLESHRPLSKARHDEMVKRAHAEHQPALRTEPTDVKALDRFLKSKLNPRKSQGRH